MRSSSTMERRNARLSIARSGRVGGVEAARHSRRYGRRATLRQRAAYAVDASSRIASDIGRLSRIVTLNDITMATAKDGLTMDATAKTFRYLDESEIAAQRKAATAKPGAKK